MELIVDIFNIVLSTGYVPTERCLGIICPITIIYNISGNVSNIIREIYNKAKSRIWKDNMTSDYFMCNIGEHQGDHLSQLLFALVIFDFTK